MECELRLTTEQRHEVEAFRYRHRSAVLTLLLTRVDNPDSLRADTAEPAVEALIERHGALLRGVLREFPEAREIPAAIDSLFFLFAKPSDAVRFALLAQRRLREFAGRERPGFRVNMGIEFGEVVLDEQVEDGAVRDVLGAQVQLVAQIAGLAAGGQVLMTRGVFDNARQNLTADLLPGVGALTWHEHGSYRLKESEAPVTLCEVGETGFAPLRPPADSESARAVAAAGAEPILGWRPAVEQSVPGTAWVLEEKIGEGGFGEVWRARHSRTKHTRIFKFCFRADRARSLRREVALFRLLRGKIGEHPNIVRIQDVYFEAPPYYIVMEHVNAKDLAKWCQERGGVKEIPFDTRIKIVIEVAKALQTAHEVGVVHRDIKPTNILIGGRGTSPDEVEVKLTDFGIGQVLPDHVADLLTTAGFTDTGLQTELSSRTGTRVYMAPEILAGRQSSIKSDLYSLGVVLYQLVIEDLAQPVTTDWRDRVEDTVIAEDIARCFAGNPDARFSSARELADNLRNLGARRKEWQEREKARLAEEESRRLVALEQEWISRQKLYRDSIVKAEKCVEDRRYTEARQLLARCPEELRHWEWGRLQYLCCLDRMTFTEKDSSPVVCVAISPDGRRFAVGGEGREVVVRSLQSGDELLRILDLNDRIDSLCFHPDSERLAVGTGKGRVLLYDTVSGRRVLKIRAHSNLVDSLAISDDGQRLASGSWDKTARIWKVGTAQPLGVLEAHSPLRVAFTAGGACLALGSWEGKAHIWDVGEGRHVAVLGGRFPGFGILAAAFSPDGALVATGGADGTARVWDAATGIERAHVKGHRDALRAIAFDAGAKHLITGGADRTARVWDLSNQHEYVALNGHGDSVNCVALGPDPSRPVTGSADGTAKTWDVAAMREYRAIEGHRSNVWEVAFSPDGRYLATCSGESVWETEADNTARIWDVESGRELLVLDGHSSNVWSVRYSPDGKWLITGSADKTAKIWNLENGQVQKNLKGHEGFILSTAFSPDGRLAATAGRDTTIRLWDWISGNEIRVLERHTDPVTCLAFEPKGNFLISGSWDHSVKIWEARTGQEIRTLSGHTDSVECVTVSPDGSVIASGGKDRTLRFWDVESGEALPQRFDCPASIASVAYSPDGKRIVTGCGDRIARIWDAESGEILLHLKGHRWFVVSAAFSPDGKLVATGSSDHTAILWPAFPWRSEDYPGNDEDPLEERVEAYKRSRFS